jgi:hypothetical protein
MVMLIMADRPVSATPRTLGEAKSIISGLRALLATPSKPISPPNDPCLSPDRPVGPPDPSPPGLAEMPPAAFNQFLSMKTDSELKVLLARETAKGHKEQNASLISKFYKELKRRSA